MRKKVTPSSTQEIWAEIDKIKTELIRIASTNEKSAQQDSRKISEYRNRSQESKEKIDTLLAETKKNHQEIEKILASFLTQENQLKDLKNQADESVNTFLSVTEKIEEFNEIYTQKDEFLEKTEVLEIIYKNTAEMQHKITASYNNLQKRKQEIDEIYFEIIGFEDENQETGEKTIEKGMKGELEQSFSQLKIELESTKKEIETYKTKEDESCTLRIQKNQNTLDEKIKEWEINYETTSKKIQSLLPEALTAGLSHAFYEKRCSEKTEGEKLQKSFLWAIKGLVAVSLIPFVLNIYLWINGTLLEALIKDAPRLVVAILPLYIPLLWLAYSSNKRVNLSKRLAEEYTHKEVLSKTFEGLSSQIENIDNEDISKELRIKLLYNILDVSSENPGKLISDYNKADHPIMDVLEKSLKLKNAVDSLNKIPGLSKVANIINDKSELILKQKAKQVEEGLHQVEVPKKATDGGSHYSSMEKSPNGEQPDYPQPLAQKV